MIKRALRRFFKRDLALRLTFRIHMDNGKMHIENFTAMAGDVIHIYDSTGTRLEVYVSKP